MAEFTIGPEETRRDIILQVGEKLSLTLAENPTTGFRWAIAPFPDDVLEKSGSGFSAGDNCGVGGGGNRTFDFVARKTGVATFALSLQREWAASTPERRVEINVEVR